MIVLLFLMSKSSASALAFSKNARKILEKLEDMAKIYWIQNVFLVYCNYWCLYFCSPKFHVLHQLHFAIFRSCHLYNDFVLLFKTGARYNVC